MSPPPRPLFVPRERGYHILIVTWTQSDGEWLARWGHYGFGIGGPLTPAVKTLLAANAAAFVFQLLADRFFEFTYWFGLVPSAVVRGAVWQVFSYMFLHGGLMHLLFNLLGLWVFGGEVEASLGTRRFFVFYIFTGVGAGLCALAFNLGSSVPLVGASGAIFGILLAYALFFPYRPITLLLFFVVPLSIQARWLVIGYGALEVLTVMGSHGGRAAGSLAHLGGLFFGWLFLRGPGILNALKSSAVRMRTGRQTRYLRRLDAERDRLQAEVDELLGRVAKSGMSGLSEEERQRLFDASKRLRDL